MKIIIQYSIADCRHVQTETNGMLTYWYRTSHKPTLCFLRNSGCYNGIMHSTSGCYYSANRAIKINGWHRFVKEQAKKGIFFQLDHRLLYLNRTYATTIYEICFDVSLLKESDILYILDELSKLKIRISKSFEEIGNDYLTKDYTERDYLTTLVKAKRQITNHYASITTKKATLLDCGEDIYKKIKCFAPQFFILLDKSEYMHFQQRNIEAGVDGKEEIIMLNRNDKKGLNYEGYIFINTKWKKSGINAYSNFSEALSIKATLDEVLCQIDEGIISPSQRSYEAERLQGFLRNCLNYFRNEKRFISNPQLKDIIYANPVLDRNLNFENLKNQIKEVINIRPYLFRLVESYLNDIEVMAKKQGNTITINNYSTGAVSVGDNNHIVTNVGLQNLDNETDKLIKQLQDNNDVRLEEIKADIDAMKAALLNKDEKKAQARYEKIKTYGGLILDFAKTIASYLPLI